MEANKVTLNDSNVKSSNLLDSKKVQAPLPKTSPQKEDTVEINGEVKTADNKKKKKFSTDEKVLCGIAGLSVAGLAAIMTGMAMVKKGRIKKIFTNEPFTNMTKRVPFNHETVLKKVPTEQELDNIAAEKIKDVTLKYGFDEHLTSANDIEKFLNDKYPDSYWTKNIASRAASRDDVRHVLRVLTGDNFRQGYGSTTKTAIDRLYILDDIINKMTGKPIDTKEFDKTIKLMTAGDQEFTWNARRALTSNMQNLKNFNKIISLNEFINKTAKEGEKINVVVLMDKGEIEFEHLTKFLTVLKKGTITDRWGNIQNYELNDLFSNDNFDINVLIKFLKSLNDKTIEHVNINSVKEIITSKDITPKAASKKLNAIPGNILEKMTGDYDASNYLKFEEFIDKKNINELTLAEKKNLMDKLIKNNSRSFSSNGSDASQLFPLLPDNKEKYCSLLNKLAKSIGINTKPLTNTELLTFEKGLNDLGKEIQNIDFNKIEIKLKMPREEFTQKAQNLMANLEAGEQRRVMDYFGFELNNGKLKGYPLNINNGDKLREISNTDTKKVIEKLRPIVVEFSEQNPITVVNGNKAFEKALNDVFTGLPELRPMIGKPQHKTHAYSLDLHTLKVLQGVTSNPKYANLSPDDKKILSIASLLHDITKAEGLRDPLHPIESAFDAFYIVQKMNLPEEQQLKVYELIRSHNWLDRLNNPKNTPEMIEKIAQDVAFDARHTNTFELAKILCEADMKAVRKDPTFFDNHKKTLQTMSDKVDVYLKRIHESQIVLPQTAIPKASQLRGAREMSENGITNKVIYMDKAPDDLSKLGFAQGTTKDNWRALVHALEQEEQMQKFNTFSVIDTEALLSTSYIDTKSYRVFRKQGFILDVNSNDIHAGYFRDFGTGYSKDIELLKTDYLFNGKRTSDIDGAWRGNRTEYRDYISGKIKDKMQITNEEYINLLEKIQSCKSITDIEKIDKNFADNLLEVFNQMDAGKRRGGRQYNEMLVTRPKIQGVFAYDKNYKDIPEFLRKYAADNDLPIIIFGK